MAEAVYILCAATSAACAILLWRGYMRSRTRFLLWCCLCFVGLMVNNILLVVDLLVLPKHDLLAWRTLSALVAVTLLLYGLIWDAE